MAETSKQINDPTAAIAAIKELQQEFLRFIWQDSTTPTELKNRHDRVNQIVENAGGSFDAWSVGWLFGKLEEVAISKINAVAALAQTSEPDALKKYGLPAKLIANTNFSRDAKLKNHQQVIGGNGGNAKSENRTPLKDLAYTLAIKGNYNGRAAAARAVKAEVCELAIKLGMPLSELEAETTIIGWLKQKNYPKFDPTRPSSTR